MISPLFPPDSSQYIELVAQKKLIVAAAITDGTHILAAQRAYPKELKGYWEFPGGKVEKNEDERLALTRELGEELGWRPPLSCFDRRLANPNRTDALWELPGGKFMSVWWVKVTNRPRLLLTGNHLELRWCEEAEAKALIWLPADLEIIDTLDLN